MEEFQSLSFEEALLRLEEIVHQLESGDLSLEEALTIFERGQALASFCTQQLAEASLKVEQLTSDGEIIEVTIS